MIGCLRTRVRKQPIIVFNFESETALKFYNLEERKHCRKESQEATPFPTGDDKAARNRHYGIMNVIGASYFCTSVFGINITFAIKL